MEKTIGAFEIRRKFGSILQSVFAKGDKYVVERHGEPVAVVVPIEVYDQWKRNREAFFTVLEEAQTRANASPEEADQLAEEAVQAARSSR